MFLGQIVMKKILLSALFCGCVLNNGHSVTNNIREDYKYLDRQQYILLSEICQLPNTNLEEGFMNFLKYISKTRDDFFQRDFGNDPRFKLVHQIYQIGTKIAPEFTLIIGDAFCDFCASCISMLPEQLDETQEQFQNDYIVGNVGPFDVNNPNNKERFFTELTKAMDNIFPEEFSQNVRFKIVSHIFGSFMDESLAGKSLPIHNDLNKRSVNECYLRDYSTNSSYGAKFSVTKHALEFFINIRTFSRDKYPHIRVIPRNQRIKIREVDIRQIFENFKNFLNTDFCKNELGYDSVLLSDNIFYKNHYMITLFNSRSYLMEFPEYEHRYIFRLVDFLTEGTEGYEMIKRSSYYSWDCNIKSGYSGFFDDKGDLKEGIIYKYSTRGDEVFRMTDEEKFRYIEN